MVDAIRFSSFSRTNLRQCPHRKAFGMLNIWRIRDGKGEAGDIEKLEKISMGALMFP
jgi:hypothetical protein